MNIKKLEESLSGILPAPHSLLPFQEEAVNRMIALLNSNGGCYNAAEPGCGKSVMTIATLNYFELTEALIVCPAIMRLVWKKEILKFGTHISKAKLSVIESRKDLEKLNKEGISGTVICSYELAASERGAELLKKGNFKVLIADEAHYLKNRKAKRTKAILNTLIPSIPKRIALSGTPITQHVSDLYTWANTLAPKNFPNYYKFVNRYSMQRSTPFGIEYYGLRNEAELNPLIRKLFYIRYLKKDVLPELPEKQWVEITLSSAYAVKKLPDYNEVEVKERMREIERMIEAGETVPVFDVLIKSIRQLQGIETAKPVAEFATDMLEQDIPIVIFAYHKNVIKILAEKLFTFNPLIISGDTPSGARQRAIEAFQGGKSNCIILQVSAAAHGITLTRSSNVIFAELDYSPAVMNQAISRCDRIGQEKNKLNIFYFLVDESLTSRIVSALIEKTKTFEKLEVKNDR